MATVNLPNTSRDADDANLFSDVVGNDEAITAQVNGNLDNENIAAAAAIGLSKLAQGSSGAVTLTAGATSLNQQNDVASSDTAVGSGSTDLPGLAITVTTGGTYLALGTFDVEVTPTAGNAGGVYVELLVDGVAESGIATLAHTTSSGATPVRATIAQNWVITPSTGHVVFARGTQYGTGTAAAYGSHSKLILLRLA